MRHLITNESCAAHYRGQASCGWPECTIRERIALIVKGREAGTVGARAQCRSAATTRVRRPSHLVPTPSCTFLPCRVWNGIFAAGDWRAKRDPKTMSLRRGRKSETTTRENWPHAALSPSLIRAWCVMSVHWPVTPLGGWATWAGGQVISFRPPQFRARRRCNSCELE